MFIPTFGLKELGQFEDLKGAFKVIYDRCLAENPFPSIMFETIWVEERFGPEGHALRKFFFEDLSKIGHDNGWLTEKGEWKA